jgi:D-alanyl-D-alanine carboxypeptidase
VQNRLRSVVIAITILALMIPREVVARTASGGPDPFGTPGGLVLKQLIDSVNSQDMARIRTFVENAFATDHTNEDSWPTRCCKADEVIRTLVNVGRRSGGLLLESAYPNGRAITAFLKTKSGSRRIYLLLQCGRSDPCRITNYQMVPLSPDPDEFLQAVQASDGISSKAAAIDRALRDAAVRQLFSGTVLIARNGKALLRGAYGDADRDRRIANSIDTPFNLASTGKLFTGIAVAQLVSEGKLSYDEPIDKYLPNYPNRDAASKITLRQLLTHTSGLADIFSKPRPKTPLHRLKDYYPLFANEPLLFEPGKGHSYSNTGFLVASMVVEAVSGEEFRHYLQHHIFDVAGMHNTGFYRPHNAARPYTRDNAEDPLNLNAHWVSALSFYDRLLGGPAAGPGGEYSTVGDLFRFATALQSGKLLPRKSFETMVHDGLGCECDAHPGHEIYSHTGGGPGVDTGLKLDMNTDTVSIFLSNFSPPFPQMFMEKASDMMTGPSSQERGALSPLPEGGPDFTGAWICEGTFPNHQVHRSNFTGAVILGGQWSELTELDTEPATGALAKYLIGYDPQQKQLVELDASSFRPE